MIFAVEGSMGFTSAARRDNAHNFVANRLAIENLLEPPLIIDQVGFTIGDSSPALRVICRFINELARDTFYTDALTQLSGVNGPVVGSTISKHTCFHDESPPSSCVTTDTHDF